MRVRAGVVSEAEVNGPMNVGQGTNFLDTSSPATWAAVWFLIAVLFLFVL